LRRGGGTEVGEGGGERIETFQSFPYQSKI